MEHALQEFKEETVYRRHLKETHQDIDESHIDTLVRHNCGIGCRGKHTCPLCETEPNDIHSKPDQAIFLAQHIGNHLKLLSLFSLPSFDRNAAKDENELDSSDSASFNNDAGEVTQLADNKAHSGDDDAMKAISLDFDHQITGDVQTGDTLENRSENYMGSAPPSPPVVDWNSYPLARNISDPQNIFGSRSDTPSSLASAFASSRRSESLGSSTDSGELPSSLTLTIEPGELRNMLMQQLVQTYGRWGKEPFWPKRVLRRVLTRHRVVTELSHSFDTDTALHYARLIRPKRDTKDRAASQKYLKVFAILVWVDRANEIRHFLEASFTDNDLPVSAIKTQNEDVYLLHRRSPHESDKLFREWRNSEKIFFARTQWMVLTPYFKLGANSNPLYFALDNLTILPFQESLSSDASSSTSFIRIEPSSHGFPWRVGGVSRSRLSRPRWTTYYNALLTLHRSLGRQTILC